MTRTALRSMQAAPSSVAEAIRRAQQRRAPLPAQSHSHFLVEVRDSRGRRRWRSNWRRNLTTDTATGYTNRRDWRAKAMGGGAAATASSSGVATAADATSLTNGSASFPTSGQGLAGQIVACGPNAAGSGSTVFGVILSNTATKLTVDQWYSAATLAAGTTPNATASYQILPGQMPAMWLAVTSDAGAPSSGDTSLASELVGNGFSRQLGTYAHVAAATTYTLSTLFTAGTTATINKEAVVGSGVAGGAGVMPFESAETSPPTLVSGDTLTQTVTITIN